MPEDPRLTDEQAALVFRRAAELDRDAGELTSIWDAAALQQVGREAGLTPASIQQAIGEIATAPRGEVPFDDLLPATQRVVRSRAIEGHPEAVAAAVGRVLARAGLTPIRDRSDEGLYERTGRPRSLERMTELVDSALQWGMPRRSAARATRLTRSLRRVDRVAYRVVAIPSGNGRPTALVTMVASTQASRREKTMSRWTRWSFRAVLVGAVAVSTPQATVYDVLVAAPVVAAGLGGLAWRSAGNSMQDELRELTVLADTFLDQAETRRPVGR